MPRSLRRSALDERSRDTLLLGRSLESQPALSAVATRMRELGEQPAPAPNDALAAMLEAGISRAERVAVGPGEQPPLVAKEQHTQHRSASSWAFVGAAAALALVLGAASQNALPARAQDAVSTAVAWITPLHLPRAHDGGQHPTPSHHAPRSAVHVPTSPLPTARPTASAPTNPSPAPTDAPAASDAPTDEATDTPTDEPTDQPTDASTDTPADNGSPVGLGAVLPLRR